MAPGTGHPFFVLSVENSEFRILNEKNTAADQRPAAIGRGPEPTVHRSFFNTQSPKRNTQNSKNGAAGDPKHKSTF